MKQIVCPKCKAQVEATLNFCPQCGSVLPLPNSNGLNQGKRLTQVNQQHVAQAILNEGKKKQNPKTALAVGVIAIVLIVVILVLLFVSGGTSSNSNTASTSTTSDTISTSSTLESSAPESSVDAFASEESSEILVEESSEESVEESSEPVEESSEPVEESSESVEESSEESSEVSAEKIVVTVEKPDDWYNIYCYIYTKGNTMVTNGEWPGEELTETDGKYQYELPEKFNGEECYIIFSSTDRESSSKAQYPYSGYDGFNLSNKTDYTLNDFEAYAEEFKAQNS